MMNIPWLPLMGEPTRGPTHAGARLLRVNNRTRVNGTDVTYYLGPRQTRIVWKSNDR